MGGGQRRSHARLARSHPQAQLAEHRVVGVFIIAAVRLYREGLERIIFGEPSLDVVGTSASLEDAASALPESRAHVALVDAAVADSSVASEKIRTAVPHIKVVPIVHTDDASEIVAWAEAGMAGCVTRHCSQEDLVATIHMALRGEARCPPEVTAKLLERLATRASDVRIPAPPPGLTPRKWQVAGLLANGLTKRRSPDICRSPFPVKNHVHSILDKLQVRHRVGAAFKLRSGEVAGTMRLVSDSPEGLPVEQFVSIGDLRADRRLIECQRLMVLPGYRGRRWPELAYGVLGGLVKACLHWCIVHGVTHIVADLFTDTPTTPLVPLMALGFESTGTEFVDTELPCGLHGQGGADR